jgi:RNA polymerase sigma factor (sigma-70 family)
MTTTAARPRRSAAAKLPAGEAAEPPAPRPGLFEIPHARGDDYATWLARRTAAELAELPEFNLSDRDDIEQDLIVRLLESWPQFDPVKSSAKTFIATVVRNGVSNLIRRRQLERRTFVDSNALPVGEAPSHEDEVDLQCDVAAVLARLPPEDRDLAERLVDSSVRQVAAEDDVSVASVRKRIAHLREAFEAAGLSLEA